MIKLGTFAHCVPEPPMGCTTCWDTNVQSVRPTRIDMLRFVSSGRPERIGSRCSGDCHETCHPV